VSVPVEGAGTAPLVRPKKEERGPPFDAIIAAEEQADAEEHLRLLYVAMTRAADRLIVSGVMPKARKDGADPRPANSWHVIVERAIAPIGAPGEDHVAVRYGSKGRPASRRTEGRADSPRIVVPAWAREAAPPESRPPRPLAPSAIAIDDEAAPPPSQAMRDAARRGTWIHQLLERLPSIKASGRPDAADRWLERSAGVTDQAVRCEIVEQVCRILSDPDYSALFGTGSLAEAPLAATLPDGRVIAGTVDRILVEDSKVSVIDFKTGKVPDTDADIPNSHRAQMTAYADALRVIFPGRSVSASILYTAGPKLIELMP